MPVWVGVAAAVVTILLLVALYATYKHFSRYWEYDVPKKD